MLFFFFFFNDTATTEIYTLSLHDALPIFPRVTAGLPSELLIQRPDIRSAEAQLARSEEHTSELQSPCNLVCRLLLEKKKTFVQELFRPTRGASPSMRPCLSCHYPYPPYAS